MPHYWLSQAPSWCLLFLFPTSVPFTPQAHANSRRKQDVAPTCAPSLASYGAGCPVGVELALLSVQLSWWLHAAIRGSYRACGRSPVSGLQRQTPLPFDPKTEKLLGMPSTGSRHASALATCQGDTFTKNVKGHQTTFVSPTPLQSRCKMPMQGTRRCRCRCNLHVQLSLDGLLDPATDM